MAQSDGKNKLSRFMIKDRGNGTQYAFTLNPQKYKVSFPQRVSALKTLDRIIVEDFNGDVPTINISGHTGFKHGQGEKKMRALRKLLDTYANGKTNYGKPPKTPLEFYNFTDGDYYYVTLSPDGYNITRDVDNPLIHNYDLNFYVLGKIGEDITNSDDFIGDKEISTSDQNVAEGDAGTSSVGDASAKDSVASVKPKDEKIVGTDIIISAQGGYYNSKVLGGTKTGSDRLRETLGVK